MWVSQTLIPHCMQRVIHCQPTKFAQSTTAHSWTFRENGYQGAWESACHPTTHCDTPSSYCRPHITQFSCIQASSCISQDAFHVIFVMTSQQFAPHILQHGWGSMNPAVYQMNFGNLMLVANASPSVGDLLLSKLGALKNKLPTIFYSRLVISECIDSVFLREEIVNTLFAPIWLNACLIYGIKTFNVVFDKINDHVLGGSDSNNISRLSSQYNCWLSLMRLQNSCLIGLTE